MHGREVGRNGDANPLRVSRPSPGRHPGGGVQADHLSIEKRVLDDGLDEVGEVFGGSETLREDVELGKGVLQLLRCACQQRSVHDPGGHGNDPDPGAGEIAR